MLSKIKEEILIKIAEDNSNNLYMLSKSLGYAFSTIFDNVKSLEEEGFLNKIVEKEAIKRAKLTLTPKGLIYVFSFLNKNDLEVFNKIIENYKNVYFTDLLSSNIFEKKSIKALLFLKHSAKHSISFLESLKEENKEIIQLVFYYGVFVTFLHLKPKSEFFEALRNDKNIINAIKYLLDHYKKVLIFLYSTISILEREVIKK
jgi:predicted transcriptional regulator